MSVRKTILLRVYLSFVPVLLLAGAIIFQIIRLQTVKHSYWKHLADISSIDTANIEAMRGNLYADDHSLLATSIPIYDIRLDMGADGLSDSDFYNNVDSLSFCLANYFKNNSESDYRKELKMAYKEQSRSFLLCRRITHTQLKDIEKFPILRAGRYKGGLLVEENSKRIMPFQSLAFRTIGYKTPGVKPVGLEGAFDNVLTGTAGTRLIERSAGGIWIPLNDANEIDPKDGQDVYTTIDINFQDYTESALLKALQTNDAEHGCAIVMEVGTGKIKAIANLARAKDGTYSEKYNYAIGESSEPGSTFKLVSVIAMLEEGVATPETMVNTTGGEAQFFDRTMKDSKEGGHGIIPLKEAFALSSNVGISKLVYQYFSSKPKEYVKYIDKLKLNKPLGLSITGEGTPVFKNPGDRDWYGTTLPWMSIGYELRVTPLQLLTLYNAVANNGMMVKPQFVSEIREAGKLVRKYDPEIIVPSICTKPTLDKVRAMMLDVVEHGTASNIRNELYQVAGKTGTAQVAAQSGGYTIQKMYKASFVGYFPAENPMYSIIIVVNNPSKGAYYGASVAAPAFKEIADKIYANKATARTYASVFGNQPTAAIPTASALDPDIMDILLANINTDKSKIPAKEGWYDVNEQIKKSRVPDVTGMTLADAMYILENAGLKVKSSGSGRVVRQSIPAGTALRPKNLITLELT